MDVDGGAGGDGVATQHVRGDGLPDGHGDGWDVAQGFAADVVEVGELIGVHGCEDLFVVAGGRVEEEGHVLFHFGAEFFLNVWVFGEQVQGPGYAGGGGVMSGAEEGHYLITHGFEAQFVGVGAGEGHVVAHDEGDDVFVFGGGFGVLGADDLRRFAEDDVARLLYVAVHLRGQVLGDGYECGEAVEHAGPDVKRED